MKPLSMMGITATAFLAGGLVLPMVAQEREVPFRLGGRNAPRPAPKGDDARPVPLLPDGVTVDFNGVWSGGGPSGDDFGVEGGLKPGDVEALFTPWAKEAFAKVDPRMDPSSFCLPVGVPRWTADAAWRMVQHPTTKPTHIFMLFEANIHSYRQIFMDGRKHPEDPSPTWYGHSIGHMEDNGKTLVIDTVGFNDKFWLDRKGHPHTEQLHVIERWTRPTYTTLHRQVTIDDPGAYIKPITLNFTARLAAPGAEILEYICNENNQYGMPSGLTNPAGTNN